MVPAICLPKVLSEIAKIESGEERRPLTQDDFAHKLFTLLSSKPIPSVDDIVNLDIPCGFLHLMTYAGAIFSTGGTSIGVRPCTVNELFEHQVLLDPDFRARANEYFSELHLGTILRAHTIEMLEERSRRHFLKPIFSEASELLDEKEVINAPYNKRFDEPVFASQTIVPASMIFTADPRLPDELLVAQFKTALAQTREYFAGTGYQFQDRNERFEKQKDRWMKYLVLQFLDLQKGLEITGHVASNEELWRILATTHSADGIEVDLDKEDSTLRKTNQVAAIEMMLPASRKFLILEARVAALLSSKAGASVPGCDQALPFDYPRFRQYRKK